MIKSESEHISSTLFLIPPDEKFLCCNHGGLMHTPVVNVECGHMFCSDCIQTLGFCPIDHMPINTLDINFQLKNELDQLLCYCKYGVQEKGGHLFVRQDGCGSIISYGSKQNHEETCRYNPVNNKTVNITPNSSAEELAAMMDNSNRSSSNNSNRSSGNSSPFESLHSPSSPFSTGSGDSSSHSFTVLKEEDDCLDINNHTTTTMNSTNKTSPRPSSTTITPNTLTKGSSEPANPQDVEDRNQLWESSTNLFFCSSRFCPNKENGCYYYGKTEENIKYHLDNECQAQRMKNKISQLQEVIEKKDEELSTLRHSSSGIMMNRSTSSISSTSSSTSSTSSTTTTTAPATTSSVTPGNDKQKTIVTQPAIVVAFLLFIQSIKKRIRQGLRKIKKVLLRKKYKKL
ncbi:hypothetical protein SAMD00019534_082570, partial [Acytostelium subglobosum LB1]|uniref:hypothetical protein n=1 Tax=Acytostelium subglobosum LB1 TaxID=1410327 RepID=UPI000644EC8C